MYVVLSINIKAKMFFFLSLMYNVSTTILIIKVLQIYIKMIHLKSSKINYNDFRQNDQRL